MLPALSPLLIGSRSRALAVLLAWAPAAEGQIAVTRGDAERAVLQQGVRVALARADSVAAAARLRTARAYPNPTLSATYSKAPPTKHFITDLPLDLPWQRGPRIAAAAAAVTASRLAYASERIAALVEVDTTYTRALASNARFRLSRQTARDADSLRRMVVARRGAGDASDLDVDLATVSAGQQLDVATRDSLASLGALLTVQTLMGLRADSVAIVLADSLTLAAEDTAAVTVFLDSAGTPAVVPPPRSGGGGETFALGGARGEPGVPAPSALGPTASVAAAEAALRAADLSVTAQRRAILASPALALGVERGDPDHPGNLPTVGIAVPLPLFSRNAGPIAEARAERERARVRLLAARLEARQRLVEGVRAREQLLAQVLRDRVLVVSAQRVASRSLTAYREGASALPAVLEARRSARDVLAQYVDDLAALLSVNAQLRALTLPAPLP